MERIQTILTIWIIGIIPGYYMAGFIAFLIKSIN